MKNCLVIPHQSDHVQTFWERQSRCPSWTAPTSIRQKLWHGLPQHWIHWVTKWVKILAELTQVQAEAGVEQRTALRCGDPLQIECKGVYEIPRSELWDPFGRHRHGSTCLTFTTIKTLGGCIGTSTCRESTHQLTILMWTLKKWRRVLKSTLNWKNLSLLGRLLPNSCW